MTAFDAGALMERMGEILARLGGQDRQMQAVEEKMDRSLEEARSTRESVLLNGQRLDDLRRDHDALNKRVLVLDGRLVQIDFVVGLGRALLNWKPLVAAAGLFALLMRDWLARKLGLPLPPL